LAAPASASGSCPFAVLAIPPNAGPIELPEGPAIVILADDFDTSHGPAAFGPPRDGQLRDIRGVVLQVAAPEPITYSQAAALAAATAVRS
jgi:hypothetical protein